MVPLAARSPARPGRASAKIPLGLRLQAWWDGNDLFLQRREGDAAEDDAPPVGGERDPTLIWQTARVRLLQEVWGEGYWFPGGRAECLRQVSLFGLNSKMSMLDLGAGLGGSARVCVEEYGVWVSGLERDAELAAAGAALSTLAGLAKKAEIAGYDPDGYEGSARGYDCVFARDVLFAVADEGPTRRGHGSVPGRGGRALGPARCRDRQRRPPIVSRLCGEERPQGYVVLLVNGPGRSKVNGRLIGPSPQCMPRKEALRHCPCWRPTIRRRTRRGRRSRSTCA